MISLSVSFDNITNFFSKLSFESKFFYIFQNLFIIGQDFSYLLCSKTTSLECAHPVGMTINPPAWSLAVELGFYLLAPFVLKNEKRTFFFVLLGCFYFLFLNIIIFPVDWIDHLRPLSILELNYYFYPSSFVFFGSGALAFQLSKRNLEPNYLASIIVIILLSFAQTVMPFWHLLVVSLAIPVLFKYTERNRIDRLIGELSYPVYIVHFPILLFVGQHDAFIKRYFNALSAGSCVAIISILISVLIYIFIENRVRIYRNSMNFFPEKTPQEKRKNSVFASVPIVYILFPFIFCFYIYFNQSANNVIDKYSEQPFNFTDSNWVGGVGINFSGFFVTNNIENRGHYQKGKLVKFSNGEVREILNISQSATGIFLNVHVNGNPLDGKKVGFPNKIKVIE
jgi:peptidoglycan/LPS O-acetylase OafA/YrhL